MTEECSGSTAVTHKCSVCQGIGWVVRSDSKGDPVQQQCEMCYGTGDEHATVPCCLPVKWIRRTQFAGDHPYCAACVVLESDFGKEDNDTMWVRIEDYKRK